jgi:hypothetical protein
VSPSFYLLFVFVITCSLPLRADSRGVVLFPFPLPPHLADILRVLDQEVAFDSLHWFDSAAEHFSQERERVVEGSKTDAAASRWSRTAAEEESANSELKLGKLKGLADELTLLQFSFTGARTFFNAA